eukprot:15367097-Ditylum_brightwellii.AAC.1
MTLEHYINNVNSTVKLVQETNKTDEEGKWLLLCTKVNTLRVIQFVDFILPKIFEEHLTEVEKMIGYDYPRCHHISGNKTIRLYAAKLKKQYKPNASYLKTAYNKIFDKLAIKRPNKCIMVNTTEEKQLDGENNNPNQQANNSAFPPISPMQAGRQKEQSTISAGNPKGASDAIEAHFQKQLEDMKAEMQGEMKSM